jgi:diguanylate cyclase (GGDEF)-like protein
LKKGRISLQFFYIVLPIAIIPLISVVSFISIRIYDHLEVQSKEFYSSLLTQVANNIDFAYKQNAMTLTDITLMENFQKIVNAPDYRTAIEEDQIATILGESGEPRGGSILRTVNTKIDGEFFIIELDRKSLVTGDDFKIHVFSSFSSGNMQISMETLLEDPLYLDVVGNPGIKCAFGKLKEGVVSVYEGDKRPVLIYPYYNSYDNSFSKFILVVLNKDYILNFFEDIERIQFGTLYILDKFNNIMAANHPGEDDYYTFDSNSGAYIKEKGDDNQDPFINLTFDDYHLLNTDPGILQNSYVQYLLNDIEKKYYRRSVSGSEAESRFSNKHIVTYNGIKYITVIEFAPASQTRYIYFHPVKLIHKPINQILSIIAFVTLTIVVLICLMIFILGHVFANPIEKKTFELEETTEKLQQLDSLKNDFIANITHDFRSPLTVIHNIADLALKFNKNLDREHRHNYDLIYTASYKLKSTIDRLLDLAKMDAQGVKLNVTRVKLKLLVENIVDFYSSAVIDSGITIEKKLPRYEIENLFTDQEKLEEVINNIISNAIKFVDPGDGKIIIEIQDEDDIVFISISDNGIGIPEDKLQTIFDRFVQTDNGANAVYKGTGIGLEFSRQLISYLKGNIWAESLGPGKGATFVIELKKGRSVYSASDYTDSSYEERNRDDVRRIIQSELQQRLNEKGVVTYINQLNRENEYNYLNGVILIVDDNIDVRNIVMEYLLNYGYKNFILATDGAEGLEAVYRYSPDLIISDYNMPNMRGDRFHDELTGNPQYRLVPFIFLSAIANRDLIHERKQKGATAYLKKPIDEKELLLTVEQQLKKHMEYLKTIHMATIDELTGLPNKRLILKSLNDHLLAETVPVISVTFLDIDHFKRCNDNHGHQGGDKVLSVVGNAIKQAIPARYLAGRYGGEEFVLIQPGTSQEEASEFAEQIRKMIESKTIQYHSKKIKITASFGVVGLHENDYYISKKLGIPSLGDLYRTSDKQKIKREKVEAIKLELSEILLKMADDALYSAKYTICKRCGFSHAQEEVFENSVCPECECTVLIKGRNRVVSFRGI